MNKSLVVAKMISGRYRTEMLCRFWSSNTEGYCEAATCDRVQGDLEHLLVNCPALVDVRVKLFNLWLRKSADIPALYHLIERIMVASPADLVKFILDPGSHPEVLLLVQQHGQPLLQHVMYLTRTLAYNLHKRKLILTGRWLGNKPRINMKKIDNYTNQSLFVGHVVHESHQGRGGGAADSTGLQTRAAKDPRLFSQVSSSEGSRTTSLGVGVMPGCQLPDSSFLTFDTPTEELTRHTQHLFDKCSVMSVSVPAAGTLTPGLHVDVGTTGAGQGHDHAHEDCHCSPSHPPSICSPTDDQDHSSAVPCLGHDGYFAAVSITSSQNSGCTF